LVVSVFVVTGFSVAFLSLLLPLHAASKNKTGSVNKMIGLPISFKKNVFIVLKFGVNKQD
jgi:hypothetical protein